MTASSPNLDLRTIFETPIHQFIPWLAFVLIVTWAGYPAVVCVTPLAWLIESALAGGIIGL